MPLDAAGCCCRIRAPCEASVGCGRPPVKPAAQQPDRRRTAACRRPTRSSTWSWRWRTPWRAAASAPSATSGCGARASGRVVVSPLGTARVWRAVLQMATAGTAELPSSSCARARRWTHRRPRRGGPRVEARRLRQGAAKSGRIRAQFAEAHVILAACGRSSAASLSSD